MTWRRFLVLVNNLSPGSMFVKSLINGENIIEDPEEAEKAIKKVGW